jgi:hypothetical protein
MYISSINEFLLVTWLLVWGWLEATGRLPDSGIARPPGRLSQPARASPTGWKAGNACPYLLTYVLQRKIYEFYGASVRFENAVYASPVA